jgi:hypothetical protein
MKSKPVFADIDVTKTLTGRDRDEVIAERRRKYENGEYTHVKSWEEAIRLLKEREEKKSPPAPEGGVLPES